MRHANVNFKGQSVIKPAYALGLELQENSVLACNFCSQRILSLSLPFRAERPKPLMSANVEMNEV